MFLTICLNHSRLKISNQNIFEKEFEMIDLQNDQNLNMLANTYLYFLNQSNYLLPISKNELLSFLNNIIHFF